MCVDVLVYLISAVSVVLHCVGNITSQPECLMTEHSSTTAICFHVTGEERVESIMEHWGENNG